jgi:hypothetical protein
VLKALAAAPLDRRTQRGSPLQRALEAYLPRPPPEPPQRSRCARLLLLRVALNATDVGASVAAAAEDAATRPPRASRRRRRHGPGRPQADVVAALGFPRCEVEAAAAAALAEGGRVACACLRVAPLGVAVGSAGAAFAALQQWHFRGLLIPALDALLPSAPLSEVGEGVRASGGSGDDGDGSEDRRRRRKEHKKELKRTNKRERPEAATLEAKEGDREGDDRAERKAAKKSRREKRRMGDIKE